MTFQIFLLALVFLAVAGLVFGIGMWLNRSEALDRRIEALAGAGVPEAAPEAQTAEWQAKVAKVAAPIAWLSTPKEGWEASNFRIRFMQAGLRGPGWPVMFFSTKTLLALVLPAVLALSVGWDNLSEKPQATLFALLSLAALGYYFPNLVLTQMIRQRRRELQEALPDAVDLMMVCVEAGLGLDAAMGRAAEEMDLRSPALADELKLIALELRVGSTRESALRNFALRTGVDDVATFVSILLQSGHFGTDVVSSLRVLSDTMRENRRMRAEEKAEKIPLKLLFPLTFFIFPALFVVLLAPPLMAIMRVVVPTITGG